MKRTGLTLILIIFFFAANAQIIKPVSWEYSIKELSSDSYELTATAYIQKPWHLYGQYFEDGGPVKLVFDFEESDAYQLIGKTEESPKPTVVRDEIFDIDVHYFSDKAVFTQIVKTNKATEINLNIEGQVCNDDTGMCVMVSGEHTFKLK